MNEFNAFGVMRIVKIAPWVRRPTMCGQADVLVLL